MLVGAGALLVAGQCALVWLTRGLTHATATTISSVVPLIVGLSLTTALLLLMAPRLGRVQPTRSALLIVFLAGLALRAVWLASPAPLEDDFKRYLWDGAVVAHGLDPYRYAPQQFLGSADVPSGYGAIAVAGRETIEGINFPDLRTIYPSVAQLSFALAYLIAPFKIDGLRAVFLVAEMATFLLLIAMLAEIKASPLWSALYWWNPTVAFVLVGIVHVDALVPPFVLGAILLAWRNRTNAAVALLGAGAGTKIWPLLLVPLVLGRVWKQPVRIAIAGLLLIGVLALAIGPVLLSSLQPNSGLAAYASSWGNNNAFFAWAAYGLGGLIEEDMAQRFLRTTVAFVGLATALAAAARAGTASRDLAHAALVVAATVFYLSPAQFPWYAVWFLPLAALLRNWPLLLASVTLPAYYLFFPLWESGRGDTFFFGAAFLHSVPVLGWLTLDAWRGRRRQNA
ncbi:MAG: hypothetical protein F9K29_15025 [Hyphomicrobiaceae bacterium]|nr:MAG: hypothetical protein F9K29_15025 [Hyphomicrobiaceae bacterium]